MKIYSEIKPPLYFIKGFQSVLSFHGQIISKGIRHSSKNEFVRSFFGRVRGYQKSFRNYLTFRKRKYVSEKLK